MTPPAALSDLVERAAAAGLLPAAARTQVPEEGRPWPVLLLTALGAWLAAVPLLMFVSMLLGPLFELGAGPYVASVIGLASAGVLWRIGRGSAFVEQLAVPLLLAGLVSLGVGVFRDLPPRAGAAVLALVVLALAVALRRSWLRVLLGAAAAVLTAWTLGIGEGFAGASASLGSPAQPWLAWLVTLAIGVGVTVWNERATPARVPPALVESIACGWLLAALAGHAWLAGMSFLVAASIGGHAGAHAPTDVVAPGAAAVAMQAGSSLLVIAAAFWLARRWPALRRAPYAVVALALAALAAFMTTLGAVSLALAACLVTHRWRRAAAAALAAAWIVGAFYYALAWPLATKAVVLAAAGMVLGAIAWALSRGDAATVATGSPAAAGASPAGPASRARAWLLALAPVAVLATSGVAIWQKEQLIAQGRPTFVELAPVDPRSLMQGDFMRLAYAMPQDVRQALDQTETTARPRVAARRDERDLLRITRLLAPGEAPAQDEEIVELSPKDGRWVIVTDAWFFREGEAKRWEAARYGEFRLLPDGRALLVGLRDAQLQPL